MKKFLSILSVLPCLAFADTISSDGIVSSDFTQTGDQTITSQLQVASGKTLEIQGSLYIDNDTNPLDNLGTIYVAEGGTLTIDSLDNKSVQANQPWSSHIGNLIIDGKVYSSIGNSFGLHLFGSTDTAKPNVTLGETGLIHLTNGRMGVNNYHSTLTLNATTSKNSNGEWETGLIANTIQQARGANGRNAIVVNAKDAFCKEDGSATDILTWTSSDLVFDFSGADGSTDIGAILFRNNTTFKFIMSDVDDVMTIGGLARYTKGDGAITGNLVFENFRNNLIKIEDYEELRLTDEGICTFDTDSDVATVTITASNGEITSEGGKWSIVDGFLCNSNFGPAVPEPAEWAMIFGSIALGLAVYRKRK